MVRVADPEFRDDLEADARANRMVVNSLSLWVRRPGDE